MTEGLTKRQITERGLNINDFEQKGKKWFPIPTEQDEIVVPEIAPVTAEDITNPIQDAIDKGKIATPLHWELTPTGTEEDYYVKELEESVGYAADFENHTMVKTDGFDVPEFRSLDPKKLRTFEDFKNVLCIMNACIFEGDPRYEALKPWCKEPTWKELNGR